MVETEAHLVDHVLPRIPMRQWVVRFPWPLAAACGVRRTSLGRLAHSGPGDRDQSIVQRTHPKSGSATGRRCPDRDDYLHSARGLSPQSERPPPYPRARWRSGAISYRGGAPGRTQDHDAAQPRPHGRLTALPRQTVHRRPRRLLAQLRCCLQSTRSQKARARHSLQGAPARVPGVPEPTHPHGVMLGGLRAQVPVLRWDHPRII